MTRLFSQVMIFASGTTKVISSNVSLQQLTDCSSYQQQVYSCKHPHYRQLIWDDLLILWSVKEIHHNSQKNTSALLRKIVQKSCSSSFRNTHLHADTHFSLKPMYKDNS